MRARLIRGGRVAMYYLSWLVFGGVGLLLNVACMPFLLLRRREAAGRRVRGIIRWLFDLWVRWIHLSRCVDIAWRGFEAPLTAGTVYVANHPTFVDATFLLARLPDAICVFKPSLRRNPATGPAAILAGYVGGASGVDLIRDAAERVAAGRSLLIFPEGTRTSPGTILGPLKPGFALIAGRAGAPVQLAVIRATPHLVPRGRPWWRPPAALPVHVEIALDRRWEPDPTRSTAALTAEVERRLIEVLAAP